MKLMVPITLQQLIDPSPAGARKRDTLTRDGVERYVRVELIAYGHFKIKGSEKGLMC